MKIFHKKNFQQKTIIAILMVLLLNFMVPTYSHADVGGVLVSPIVDFVCSFGDVIINLLQRCMTGEWGAGIGDSGATFNLFMIDSEKYFANQGEYEKVYAKAEKSIDGGTINPDASKEEGGFDKGWLGTTKDYQIPVATYSPEQIFAGRVAGLDINFINPNKYSTSNGDEVKSSAEKLKTTISQWYVALRNIAIVGLLIILVYVGIRIVISSTATDKAKYKQLFMDWLIALCLIFVLHYIMAFTITAVESIVDIISNGGNSYVKINIGAKTIKTNLLGEARLKTQYSDLGMKLTYLVIYLFLVYYTVFFTFTYLKRMLMMAFLTIIAPLVALTYPIDKINDGQAQAFNSWLKEYVYNALIQPFHLILYYVFVTSAMNLVEESPIYAIAAMWFITKAEGILRNLFGFNKAPSLGNTMAGFAGGMAANSLLNKLKGGSSKKGGGQNGEQNKPIRFNKKHGVDEVNGLPAGNQGDNLPDSGDDNNGDNPDALLDGNDKSDDNINEDGMTPEVTNHQLDSSSPLGGNGQRGDDATNNDAGKQTTNRLKNWTNAHGGAKNIAGKTIKGISKAASKGVFTVAGTTLGAMSAAATGKGLTGMIAGGVAGGKVGNILGGKAADAGINAVHKIGHGATRLGSSLRQQSLDPLLGGTAVGRELDLANGNTRYQDAGKASEIKKDEDNIRYVREKLADEHGGVEPSAKEVKEKMESLDPYIAAGIDNIKDMLNAQKAEKYTSPQQAAIIAAIGKERGITADILNDDKKSRAQNANLTQEFINKGYSKDVAKKQADYTMNILKVQNGLAHNLNTKNKGK